MTGTPSPAPGSPEALPQARRRKRSPLPTLLGVLAVGGLAGFILFGNVGKSLEYFVTPTEYQQQQDRLQGKAIRIGGLVKDVKNDPQSLNLSFTVTDGGVSFPVKYQGAVSDLFRENQGVVVRGEFQGTTFHATELIVKHSEEYNVPENQADLKKMLQDARPAN
ncbi:cytochrome c maturation protein CcmE [Deinococcus fonticola]|uniref:cytochrome c maturation protein CcmE n=1 Tax=Deinococcus fonticola TaxID=2528713 RepID=UPI001074E6E6|nr:cytochrome c maturation protein CcmE [Deinococcus fonticola]